MIAAQELETRRSTARMPFLDGIRGIAILSVLFYHASEFIQGNSVMEYLVKKMLAPCWLGVDVFFVLSGFLITGILLDSKSSTNYFSSFYMRRTLRIFPLYFASLILVFVILPSMKVLPWTTFSGQIFYWTYLYNWQAALGGAAFRLVHFWSLGVEEQFYAFWPVLLYVVPTRRTLNICFALAGLGLLFQVGVLFLGLPNRYAYFMTPGRVDDLAMGAIVAVLVRQYCSRLKALQCNTSRIAVFLGVLLLAAAIWGKGLEPNKSPALVLGTIAVCGLTAVAIIDGLRSGPSAFRSLLEAPILRWFGIYSYGIYVIHGLVMRVVQWQVSLLAPAQSVFERSSVALISAILMIAISCVLAYISYHSFEKRFLNLKPRFAASASYTSRA